MERERAEKGTRWPRAKTARFVQGIPRLARLSAKTFSHTHDKSRFPCQIANHRHVQKKVSKTIIFAAIVIYSADENPGFESKEIGKCFDTGVVRVA